MNTTQRILSNGGHPTGCHSFLCELFKNNPVCGWHWQAAINNNPGGQVPVLNPSEWDEQVARWAATAI